MSPQRVDEVQGGRSRGWWRRTRPHHVDQLVLWDWPAPTQQEKRKEHSLLRCRDGDDLVPPSDLERSENTKLERRHFEWTLAAFVRASLETASTLR